MRARLAKQREQCCGLMLRPLAQKQKNWKNRTLNRSTEKNVKSKVQGTLVDVSVNES